MTKPILAEDNKITLYTVVLDENQMMAVKNWCDGQLYESAVVPYARFSFKGNKVTIVGYLSGKLVVQGKNTEDFVKFFLEPEVTKKIALGYDKVLHPEWFEPHAGLDESGKGDLFGPLVTGCVIADEQIVDHWLKIGIRESKRISSDTVVLEFDKKIRQTKGVIVETVFAGMEKYNLLYDQMKNLNDLLAWMHAKALESALKRRFVNWGMLDQFAKKPLVQKYFKSENIILETNSKLSSANRNSANEKKNLIDSKNYEDLLKHAKSESKNSKNDEKFDSNREINTSNKFFDLRMQTKAESDPVVAAASIVARAEFIRQMRKLSEKAGENLSKGVSASVIDQAKRIIEKFGKDDLKFFAKMHFKTTDIL